MDILAHGLWAAAGIAFVAQRHAVTRTQATATVALALMPDLAHLVPLLVRAPFADGGWRTLAAYAMLTPSTEPALPAAVALVSHHLHCALHSALVAAAATLLLCALLRRFWWPLLGWWSHIAIDVPTHSAEFYPSPVLYPLSDAAFDGLAWNLPWLWAANYAALALVTWGFVRRARSRPR